MNFIYRLEARKTELETMVRELQPQVKKMPQGILICYKNKKSYRWIRRFHHEHRKQSKSVYLPKENKELAKQLALKTYYTFQIEDAESELFAIKAYLKAYEKKKCSVNKTAEIFNNPGYMDLLPHKITQVEQENQSWQSQEYHHLEEYSNEKKIPVSRNLSVRSKSEAIIAKTLDQHRIPYRYECELVIQGTSFYPDFTIRHPKTGELFYWEHFGLMDNPIYAAGCARKIQVYSQEKIYPMQNLIITSEDGIRPLNPNLVQTLVEHYFLN